LTELGRQIYLDGTSFEHSVHYHELACEMALSYLLLSRRNGLSVRGGGSERCSLFKLLAADHMECHRCLVTRPRTLSFP
jgi:hypothetical protein